MQAASAPGTRAGAVRGPRVDARRTSTTVLAAGLSAVWTGALAGSMTGRIDLPLRGVLAVSIAAVVAANLRRDRLPAPIRLFADWMAVASLAAVGALALEREPRLAVAAAVVLAVAIAAARRPPVVLALLVLLGASSGFLAAFAPAVPVRNAMDLLLAGVLLAALAVALRHGRRRAAFAPGLVVLAVYVGVTALQALGTPSVELGLQSFRLSAWPLLLVLVVAYAPWDRQVQVSLGRVLVAVAVLVGGYATYRWLVGPSAKELELAYGPGRNNDVFGTLRTFGSFPSRTELSGWCALVIPLCVAQALAGAPRWRLAAAAGGVLCAFGLFAADNRGALVAVAAGTLTVLLLATAARALPVMRAGRLIVALAAIAVVGTGTFALTLGDDEQTVSRFYRVVQDPHQDVSFVARSERYSAALEEIEDRPLGYGLGTAGGLAIQRRLDTIGAYNLDSSIFKIALEQGVPVVLLFLAAIGLTLADLVRRARTAVDPGHAVPAVAAAGTLVALCVLLPIGLYIENPLIVTAWLIIGLGAATVTGATADRRIGDA